MDPTVQALTDITSAQSSRVRNLANTTRLGSFLTSTDHRLGLVNWIYFLVPEYSEIPGVYTSTAFQSGWLDRYLILYWVALQWHPSTTTLYHTESHLPFSVLSQPSHQHCLAGTRSTGDGARLIITRRMTAQYSVRRGDWPEWLWLRYHTITRSGLTSTHNNILSQKLARLFLLIHNGFTNNLRYLYFI